MSEPKVTRERMLAYLDEASKYFTSTPEEEDYETYQAIRALIEEHGKLKKENIMLLERIENLKHALIEHGPEVDEETLESLLGERSLYGIIRYLRQKGVTVIK